MMNEERFASRIRQALNHTLDDIPPAALRRMEAARHHALSRQQQTEAVLVASATGSTIPAQHSSGTHPLRAAFAISALLAGMALAAYWQAQDYVTDIADVDAALLTDELPPEAFLDKGFSTWLLDDSSEE